MFDQTEIYFASLDNIILFPLFILLIIGSIQNFRRIKNGANILVHPANISQIFKSFSLRKIFFKTIFLSLAIFLFFIALLQPQWGKKEQTVIQEGKDILIILDISRSMLSQDLKPDRLKFAKLKIRTLLSKLTFERVGLIVFSGSAFLQCPLTIDYPAFLMYLDYVDAETISSGTTALDTALSKAIETFANIPERKNKLVILFTDGEDFSLNLNPVKEAAGQQEIKIFTIGVGTPEGAPIPKIDLSGNRIDYEKDSSGNIILSKLNEELLSSTSKTLNGAYFRATQYDTDIDNIISQISKFEKEKFSDKKLSLYEEQYPLFLGIAWVLLVLEWIL